MARARSGDLTLDIAIPAPDIWTPDYSRVGERLKLPRWARPWDTTTLDDCVQEAVAINTTGAVAGFETNPTSPKTQAYTNTSGTLMTCWVGVGVGGTDQVTSAAVTYNSVSMTLLLSRTTAGDSSGADSALGGCLFLFYLLSPATGSNTLSVSFTKTGTAAVANLWFCGMTYTGNHATVPFTQSNSTYFRGTSPSVGLTSVTSMTIGCCGGGTTLSAQTQTAFFNYNDPSDGNSMGNGRGSTSTATGPVTHGYTMGATDSSALIVAEIRASGTGRGVMPADRRRRRFAQSRRHHKPRERVSVYMSGHRAKAYA